MVSLFSVVIFFRCQYYRRSMNRTPVALLTVLIMVLTPLSGCINSQNGPATPSNPYTEPDDAYGLWDPTVDGHISLVPDQWGETEWSDGLEELVAFNEVTGAGALTQNSHPATFHLKKVNFDPENTLALAVEFGGSAVSKSGMAAPTSVEVTVDSRVLTNQVVSSSTGGGVWPPTYSLTGNVDDKLESVYNTNTGELVIESSSDHVFTTSNEIEIGIKVLFADGSYWSYSRISHFKYVVPINLPQNDLEIKGIEITQAIQTENNDVTLVEGKDTMVRVYVDTTLMSQAYTKVTLEYCTVVLGCYDHMVKLHGAMQIHEDREDIFSSANFIIPNHWTLETSGMMLKASVEPYYIFGVMDYAEIDWDDNTMLAYNFQFHETMDLTVWTVRVGNIFGPACTSNCNQHMSSFESELMMDMTEVLLPVSGITTVDFPEYFVPDCPWTWGADNCMSQTETWWRNIVMQGSSPYPDADQIHSMTPSSGDDAGFHDVGGLSAPAWAAGYGGTGSTIGWQPLIGSLHSARGVCSLHAYACTAHEMTHNLGPFCWDAAQPGYGIDCNDIDDEAWGNHLSTTGVGSTDQCHADGMDTVWHAHFGIFDIKDIGWNPMHTNPDSHMHAIVPADYPDYMSNCEAHTSGGSNNYRVPYLTDGYKQWVSTHRWEWLFDKFDNWQDGNPAHPYNGRSDHSARMIVGTFENDGGGATLDNSWTIDGFVDEKYRNYGQDLGDEAQFTILAKDDRGTVLETIRFGVSNITGHRHGDVDGYFNQSSPFIYTLQDDGGEIHRLELYDNHHDELIDVLTPNNDDFSVSIDRIGEVSRDRMLNIGWCVTLSEDSACSDDLFYSQVEYSWDGDFWMPLGTMELRENKSIDLNDFPGGDAVQFRIRATDGFDTATVLTDTYSLSNLAPEIVLDVTGPSEFAMGSGSLNIIANVGDPEWEHIDYDNIVAWLEGPDGVIIDVCGTNDDGSNQTDGRDGYDNNCDDTGDDDEFDCHTHMHSHGGDSEHIHCHTHGGINIGTIGFGLEPGDYVLNVEYTDSAGNIAEAEYRFTVTLPEYSSFPLEDFRELLVHIDDAVDSDLMYRGSEAEVSRAIDAESDLDVDI